jgi:hypothetical protein
MGGGYPGTLMAFNSWILHRTRLEGVFHLGYASYTLRVDTAFGPSEQGVNEFGFICY